MAGVRTWRWVLGFPIHRPPRRSSRSLIRDIVAENRMPFEPHQSLAGCITNIRWRLPACDRVIADYTTLANGVVCQIRRANGWCARRNDCGSFRRSYGSGLRRVSSRLPTYAGSASALASRGPRRAVRAGRAPLAVPAVWLRARRGVSGTAESGGGIRSQFTVSGVSGPNQNLFAPAV